MLFVSETPADLTGLLALQGDLLRREESEGVEQPLDAALCLPGQAQGEGQVPQLAGGGLAAVKLVVGNPGLTEGRVGLTDHLRADQSLVSQFVKSQLQGNLAAIFERCVGVGPGYLNLPFLPLSTNLAL